VVDLLILETDKSNITPVWVKTIITNIIDIEKSKNFTSELKSESNKKDKVKNEEPFQDDYVSVMFRGPVGKWSVIRKEDKVVLREKIGTKEEANKIANEISNQINDR
jgi:nucleoside diphosphate kinase